MNESEKSFVGSAVTVLVLIGIIAVGFISFSAAVFLVVVSGFSWLVGFWSERHRKK